MVVLQKVVGRERERDNGTFKQPLPKRESDKDKDRKIRKAAEKLKRKIGR